MLDKFSQIINSSEVNLPQATADTAQSNILFNVIAGIAAGIALLMFVIGAFKMALSSGDPQRIQSARDTIIYSIIGLVLTLAARLIVGWILGLNS